MTGNCKSGDVFELIKAVNFDLRDLVYSGYIDDAYSSGSFSEEEKNSEENNILDFKF